MSILLYGANGYVGTLLAAAAAARGLDVTIGARASGVAEQARSLGLEHVVGDVDTVELSGHEVLLNAAGPFARTATRLAERCVAEGVHYLDIAGEVPEFRAVQALEGAAAKAGVMLMPGVGFGVVHTDCMAAHLANRIPDAVSLELAFSTRGGVSAGTLRTMTSGFGSRGEVATPELATREVPFPSGDQRCLQNPWRGDLLTAPLSTGLRDVTTWTHLPRPVERAAASAHRKGDPHHPPAGTRLLRLLAGRAPRGPSARQRSRGSTEVWATVTNGDGRRSSATLELPDAYDATVDSALEIARRVASGTHSPGFRTPSQVFGADLVLDLPGTTRVDP